MGLDALVFGIGVYDPGDDWDIDLYAPASKADICDRLPDVSVRTVERVLARLVREGKVEKIGTYRDARYRRL